MAKLQTQIITISGDENEYEVYDQQARTDSQTALDQVEALEGEFDGLNTKVTSIESQVETNKQDIDNLKKGKLSSASLKSSYVENTKTLSLSTEVIKG